MDPLKPRAEVKDTATPSAPPSSTPGTSTVATALPDQPIGSPVGPLSSNALAFITTQEELLSNIIQKALGDIEPGPTEAFISATNTFVENFNESLKNNKTANRGVAILLCQFLENFLRDTSLDIGIKDQLERAFNSLKDYLVSDFTREHSTQEGKEQQDKDFNRINPHQISVDGHPLSLRLGSRITDKYTAVANVKRQLLSKLETKDPSKKKEIVDFILSATAQTFGAGSTEILTELANLIKDHQGDDDAFYQPNTESDKQKYEFETSSEHIILTIKSQYVILDPIDLGNSSKLSYPLNAIL